MLGGCRFCVHHVDMWWDLVIERLTLHQTSGWKELNLVSSKGFGCSRCGTFDPLPGYIELGVSPISPSLALNLGDADGPSRSLDGFPCPVSQKVGWSRHWSRSRIAATAPRERLTVSSGSFLSCQQKGIGLSRAAGAHDRGSTLSSTHKPAPNSPPGRTPTGHRLCSPVVGRRPSLGHSPGFIVSCDANQTFTAQRQILPVLDVRAAVCAACGTGWRFLCA